MLDTKTAFQSLTINSALIGLASQVLEVAGVEIAPEQINGGVNSVITIAAIGVAIYGRLRAKKAIAPKAAG